jgi:threonine dehydrogenase-like Zn-dependent dehydrogenase
VESFGDSVIPGEPPHRGDFLSPRMQRIAQLDKLNSSIAGLLLYPPVPGHDVAGVVDELGAGVTVLKKGQRVGVG